MKIRYLFFSLYFLFPLLVSANLNQSIEDSIYKIDEEIQKIEDYKNSNSNIHQEISDNKVKYSTFFISVTSRSVKKEELNNERKILNSTLSFFQKRLSELDKIIEASNNFYLATKKSEESFEAKIIQQKHQNNIWRSKQLLKKHKKNSEHFFTLIQNLLILQNELNNFIEELNNWNQHFKQNVKQTTFKWEKERVLFSASVIKKMLIEIKELPKRFIEVGLDYDIAEPQSQKMFDLFIILAFFIIFTYIFMSVLIFKKLRYKTITQTNIIEASLYNAVIKYRWIFVSSVFLFLLFASYTLCFKGYPTLIYALILIVLSTLTVWKIGLHFIKTYFQNNDERFYFVSEKLKKRTIRHLSSIFTALCLVLMLKIPKQIYGVSGELFHTIYFICFLSFIFLSSKALWKIKIGDLLVDKSKRVRFFARISRVFFLFILFLILGSLVLEATGFITLSSTMQKIFLYNFTTIAIAWMLYAIGSEFINISFIKSIEKSKISFKASVAIKNFNTTLLNTGLIICSLLLITKAWTNYIFIIPSLMDITILSIGEHSYQQLAC